MPKKILLFCSIILLSAQAYGLNELLLGVLQNILLQKDFERARQFVKDHATAEEAANLIAEIDQVEVRFEDAVRFTERGEQLPLVVPQPRAIRLPEALQAGPATFRRTAATSQAGSASMAPSAVLQAAYNQLGPKHLEQIYDALLEKDEDFALAVIMSANISHKTATELLKAVVLPHFYATQPRQLERPPLKTSEGSKEKAPAEPTFIKDIKDALDKNDMAQAEQLVNRIETLSKSNAELYRYVTEARFLIAQAKDAAKQAAERLAKEKKQRLTEQQAHKKALEEETIEYEPMLKKAKELLQDRKIDAARKIYQEISDHAFHEGDVWLTAQMMLKRLAEPVTAPKAAALPAPTQAPTPTPSAPSAEPWESVFTHANELADSRSLSEQAQAKKLYKEIINGSAPEEIKKNARIALRKLA